MKELKLYIFGRSKDDIEFIDVPDNIIVATNEKLAREVLINTPYYDEATILKNVIELNQLKNRQIIL